MTVLIAVLAFIGGVTAVAVKGWIDYALEERRERKVLRAVARLISSELGGTKAFLQTVLVTDDRVGWWPKETSPFATPAWNEHRYLLAAGTNSVDWRLMRQAYASMPGLEAQYERATRGGKLGAPLHEDERAIVELEIDIIDTAIKTLADLENARLPFEGFRRTRYAIRHPVRATRLWRKNALGGGVKRRRAGRHLELRDAPDLSYGTRPLGRMTRSAMVGLEAVSDVSRPQM